MELELGHIPAQFGLVAGSHVGLDPLQVGLHLLMSMLLLGVIVMYCMAISFDIVVSVVQSVQVVLERLGRFVLPGMLVMMTAFHAVLGVVVPALRTLAAARCGIVTARCRIARHKLSRCAKPTPIPIMRRQDAFSWLVP